LGVVVLLWLHPNITPHHRYTISCEAILAALPPPAAVLVQVVGPNTRHILPCTLFQNVFQQPLIIIQIAQHSQPGVRFRTPLQPSCDVQIFHSLIKVESETRLGMNCSYLLRGVYWSYGCDALTRQGWVAMPKEGGLMARDTLLY
jgi:hypothetical protein